MRRWEIDEIIIIIYSRLDELRDLWLQIQYVMEPPDFLD